MANATYHIGVEMGGTGCKIGFVSSLNPEKMIGVHMIPTESPKATVHNLASFILEQPHMFSSIGIASFGPICMNEKSDRYGYITNTPKPGWQFVPILHDLVNAIRPKLTNNFTIAFDTDCNVLAEYLAKPDEYLCYITVGTGVGIGLIINGKPVHGMMHPEGGHVKVLPHPNDNFGGVDPFHKNSVEGMVSNVAIAERLGLKSRNDVKDVSPNHEVWDFVATQLGGMVANIALTCSVHRVVLGGGIMNSVGLLEKIRKHMETTLNGYIASPVLEKSGHGKYLGLIAASVIGMRSKKRLPGLQQAKL